MIINVRGYDVNFCSIVLAKLGRGFLKNRVQTSDFPVQVGPENAVQVDVGRQKFGGGSEFLRILDEDWPPPSNPRHEMMGVNVTNNQQESVVSRNRSIELLMPPEIKSEYAFIYTARFVASFKAKINFSPSFHSISPPSASRFYSAENIMIGFRLQEVSVVGALPGLMHHGIARHECPWFGTNEKITFPFSSCHHMSPSRSHSRRHCEILLRHLNFSWKRFRDWFLRFNGRYASWTRFRCYDVIIIELFMRGKPSLAILNEIVTDIHSSNDVPFRRVEILISSERA